MKKLTKGQRFALAREARRLAMECLTNGPELEDAWCGCAVGLSLKRAGLWVGDPDISHESCEMARDLDRRFSGLAPYQSPESCGLLSLATRERLFRDNPTAVVIPLLAWADELEAAGASKTPPEGSSMKTFAAAAARPQTEGRCMSIRNRECLNQRVNGDYMCRACRKEYDDYLYHRDLDRKEMLSGEWNGSALENDVRRPGGGTFAPGSSDYSRGED